MPVFQDASELAITRSTFYDVAGDVNFITNTAAPSGIGSSTASASPQSASDAQIYSRQLLLKRHGFPLWCPEPYGGSAAYRSKGVRIGDVGYVTKDGAFETLFNVRASCDDPINEQGVPDGFEQITIGPRDITHIQRFHRRNGAIISGSGATITISTDPSGHQNRLDTDTSSLFTWRTSEGAILHLPDGGSRLVCRPELFKRHAIKHGSNWYRFARNNLHCEIPNGGLCLVTGTDKTDSWMVGAFSQQSSENELLLRFGTTELTEGNILYSYSWVPEGLATYRTGPELEPHSTVNTEDIVAIQRDNVLFEGDAPGGQSQCVFVRGYRISLQKSVWAAIMGHPPRVMVSSIEGSEFGGMAGGNERWFSRRGLSTPFSGGFLGGGHERHQESVDHDNVLSSEMTDEAMVDFMTEESDLYNPAIILNDHLLQMCPEAKVAIIHDDEWSSLIQEDDKEFPKTSEFISRLSKKYAIVAQSEGVSVLPVSFPNEDKNDNKAARHQIATTAAFSSSRHSVVSGGYSVTSSRHSIASGRLSVTSLVLSAAEHSSSMGPNLSRVSVLLTAVTVGTPSEDGFMQLGSQGDSNDVLAGLRDERRYRMLLDHEFHQSLTLPLWSPSPVSLGAVGYLLKPSGSFVTLFNAFDPTKSSGGILKDIPNVHVFGSVTLGSQRHDKRNIAQKGFDAMSGFLTFSQKVARRYSFPLRAGRRAAYLCTETTKHRYVESMDAPKRWFKANVDRIVQTYGSHHPIQKEDVFLVVGTLDASNYALFVSHQHPDGQVHFNVLSPSKTGQDWGMFTTDTDMPDAGPLYQEELRDDTRLSSNKVSIVGSSWNTVLIARLRFKPDVAEPTLL